LPLPLFLILVSVRGWDDGERNQAALARIEACRSHFAPSQLIELHGAAGIGDLL
jgi:hypothetical protein